MALAGILEIQLMANMARLSTDMQRAEKTVHDSMDKMGNSVAGVEAAFGKLGHTLALGAVFDQVRRLTDDYTKLTAQLRIATKTQAEYAQGLADVRRIAAESQGDLKATASLYTRLSNSLAQFGATQKQVSSMTEAVALGLKAYGATATEASSAMLQLTQAIGSNRLGGDEFRALMEEMPNMMRILAKSMGVTFGALKTLSAEGKITNAELLKAWSDPALIAALMKQATMTRTITGEMMVFRNNLTMLVGEFMGASKGTEGITASLHLMSDSVLLLAENLKILVLAVTVLSLAYAGKFAVGLVSATNLTLAHSEALAINAAMNLRAAEATNFGAKAALAQGAASALATGETAAATAANVAYRKSAVELAAAQTAASASAVTGITAVGVAMRTAIMANPLLAVATAIGLIVVAIANWDDIIKTSKASLKWFRDDFLGGMGFLAASVGIGIGELVQKLSLLANLTVPQLKSGEFKKQWDELGKLAEQSRIDAAARIAGVGGKQDAAATIEKNAPFSYSARWLVDSGKYMTTAAKRVQEIAAVTKEYQVNIAQLNKEVSTGLRDSANAALVRATLDKGLKDQIAGINREHALAPNVSTFGGMAASLKELIAENKTHETHVGKVTVAYENMHAEMLKAGKDAQMLAAVRHKYGTEAEYQDALAKAQKIDDLVLAEKAAKEAKTASEYAKEQIAKINVLEAARTSEMEFQRSLQGKSKDDQELLLAYHKEELRYAKEISDIRNSSQFAGSNPAVLAEMQKVLDKAKTTHETIKVSIEPTLDEARANAEMNKIRDNFKGVFDGLLEPGVHVPNKIAKSFGAAVNKSIKDALNAALFDDMRDRMATSAANGMKPITDIIKKAKGELDVWATDTFGSIGGAAKGSDQAKQIGMGVSDAMVQMTVALFSRLSRSPSQAQLNSVNQQYIQQWQGTGTVLGDMSAKSTSIVTAMDTLNKTTFAHTDYLAQMNTSMRNMDKNMSSLLTELGKTLGVTGLSQTPIGGTITTKVISDGVAILGNVIGSFFGASNIGSLLQGLFGSSSTSITGTGINFGGTAKQLQQGQGGSQYTSGTTTSESFWGLFSSTSTWTRYAALNSSVTKALGAVFVNIGDTIKAAAVSLGGDATTLQRQLDAFVISTGNVSLAGMNVQQQQQALTNIVSQQSDLMVAAIVPSMRAFQVSGEGLLQTLVRVVSEIATITEFYKVLGDTTTVTAASADALITALGGVDAANQAMTKFVSNFAPDAVKSAQALNALQVALNNAGLNGVAPMIKTTQDYFALMQIATTDQRVILLQQQDTALTYIKTIGSAMNLMLDKASKASSAAKNDLGAAIANASALAQSVKGAAQSLYTSFMQQMTPNYQQQMYKAALGQLQTAYDQYKATGVAPNAASLQQAVSTVSQGGTQMFASALDWKRSTMQTIDLLSGMGNLADAQVTVLTQISGSMDKLLAATQEQNAAINAGNMIAAADAAGRAAVQSANLAWLLGVNSILSGAAKNNTLVVDLVAQTVAATVGGNAVLVDTLQKYITAAGQTMIGSGATTGANGSFSSAGSAIALSSASALNQVAGMTSVAAFTSSLPSFAVGTSSVPFDMTANIHAGEEITPRPFVDARKAAQQETNDLLARLANPNAEVVAELKAVRRELADIRRTNQNMDWTTDKWDNAGMPEVRTV